jgi:hypothetical protein
VRSQTDAEQKFWDDKHTMTKKLATAFLKNTDKKKTSYRPKDWNCMQKKLRNLHQREDSEETATTDSDEIPLIHGSSDSSSSSSSSTAKKRKR